MYQKILFIRLAPYAMVEIGGVHDLRFQCTGAQSGILRNLVFRRFAMIDSKRVRTRRVLWLIFIVEYCFLNAHRWATCRSTL